MGGGPPRAAMGHPQVENRTPFVFEALHVADEDGWPVVAALVKGTFDLKREAKASVAAEQQPVLFAGAFYGDPESSSYRFEPEFAFVKPQTDVVLLGHAVARRPGTTEMLVRLRLGALEKRALVTGDRVWSAGWLGARASPPKPIERIPLIWERAFGGFDPATRDSAKPAFEPRNPVGVGFRARGAKLEDGAPLPNVEDPGDRLSSYTGRATPVGFGFVSPSWEPRARFAGTYDAAWDRSRKPLLPSDFDRRFFNAAATGLALAERLRGDEPFEIEGVWAGGVLRGSLPGLAPPRVRMSFAHKSDEVLDCALDTLVLDADRERLILTWRAHTSLRDGPHDLRSVLVARGDDAVWTRVAVAVADSGADEVDELDDED